MGARTKALANAAKLVEKASADAPEKPKVAPLKCPSCSAPVPLGDGEVATCAFCHATVPLPDAYRKLRDSEQQRGADRDRAEQLYRELGSPPSAALRAWASFAALASTALFGVVMVILTISSALILLAGFALELVLHALAGPLGIDLIDRFGGGTVYAAFVVIVIVGGLLPIWATNYFDTLAQIKHTLQINLAAIPPEKPGFPSTCRGCGAALDVPTGAYGVRCPYCQADNIVSLPPEWLTNLGQKQAAFHRSIVTAVDLADQVRKEARANLPSAAKWSLGAVVVFGLIGRGCSSLDSEDVNTSFRQSMSSPRQMFSYWEPDIGVPSDKMAPFKHLPYTIALRHRETLVWSSSDEGWGGRIEIKNTTSFPFTTKSWERPWLPQTDGTYAAKFTAPYTGLFVVKLNSNETSEGDTHLRWTVHDDATPGIPAAPPIASANAEPFAPPDKLSAIAPGRSDLSFAATGADITITTIATGKEEKKFARDAPIVALAISRDGHMLVTAAHDAIIPAKIHDKLFDSGYGAALPDSAGAVTLAFIDKTVFASGDAAGVIKIWDAQRGMELYELPKLPSAVTALSVSQDGSTLTANFASGARSFTVKSLAVWSQHG